MLLVSSHKSTNVSNADSSSLRFLLVIMRPPLCNNHKLTRCNQDLVFFGAHTEEGEVILRVDIPDGAPRLHGEAAEKSCVLHSGGVIQSSSDGNTWKHEPARSAAHKCCCDASSASP